MSAQLAQALEKIHALAGGEPFEYRQIALEALAAFEAAPQQEPVGRVRLDSGEVHFHPFQRDAEASPLADGTQLYAAPQQAQAPGWQPIETAPKDGTEFWGWRPHGRVQQGVAYRVPRDDCEMWHFAGSSANVDIAPDLKPTHWMPLPAAPQQGSNT